MSKPNTYVQLLNAQKEIVRLRTGVEVMKGFTLQQSLDMAQIALNRAFSFGPKRNKAFEEAAFKATFREYAQLCVDDGTDDPEIIYTKEKVDRALRIACGEEIKPFDERYALENLYFRDQLREDKHG